MNQKSMTTILGILANLTASQRLKKMTRRWEISRALRRKKKGLVILETLRRKKLRQLRWKTRNRKTSGTSVTLRRLKLRMPANKNLNWRLAQVKNQRLSKRTMTSATLVDSRDSPSKTNLRKRVKGKTMTGQMTSRKRSLSPRVWRRSPSQTSRVMASGTLAMINQMIKSLSNLMMAALVTSMKHQSLNKNPKTTLATSVKHSLLQK